MTLHRQATKIASKGRKGDSVLVHMTPKEVAGLQSLALSAYGKPLTINPKTGLVEASLLKKFLPTIVGGFAGAMGLGEGWGTVLGGIAGGAANGWNLKNVGLGALGGWGGQQLGARLNTVGAPGAGVKTGSVNPAVNPVTTGAGSQEDLLAAQFGSAPPVTPNVQAAVASNQANEAAAKTTRTPVKVETKGFAGLKQAGEGLKSVIKDPAVYKEFFNDSMYPMGAAYLGGALVSDKVSAPKQDPAQHYVVDWRTGQVNPDFQKVRGAPYYMPGTRGPTNGRYVSESEYSPSIGNYWWMKAPGAAGGGYFADGGEVPAVPTAVPDPRLTYTSPYSGSTYKSPYADDLAAYIDKVGASIRRPPPVNAGPGTGTGTGTNGGGGGGVGPGGGGGGPGGSNIADSREPMGGENTGYPVDAVGPGMSTQNGRGDAGTGSFANYSGSGFGPLAPPGTGSFIDYSGAGYGPGPYAPPPPDTTPPATTPPADNAPPPDSSLWDDIKKYGKFGLDTLTLPRDLLATVGGNLAARVNPLLGNVVKVGASPGTLINTVMHPLTHRPPNNSIIQWLGADQYGMTPEQKAADDALKADDAKKQKEWREREAAADIAEQSGAGQRGSSLTTRNSFDVTSPFFGGWSKNTPNARPPGFPLKRGITGVQDVAHGGMLGYGYAGGGGIGSLGSYSDGGRFLKGPGDGVSDDIPGVIHHSDGQQQPARLATGEFVFPARIVSEIGNGSSEAGAQKLYAIMDRIQNDRKRSIKDVALNSNADRHFNSMMA